MKNKTVFLSHLLNEETPGYGGNKGFENTITSSIEKGDTSNSQKWAMSNHIGTHIDFPKHFDKDGKTADYFSSDFFDFKSPYLLNIHACRGSTIFPSKEFDRIPRETDLLLIKTGFEKYRKEKDYFNYNPGIAPEVAEWLRENAPNVRAIGLDTISLTGYQNRPLGRMAHKAFLQSDKAILIIEDMKLSILEDSPKRVIVAPLRVEGADGSPVTVLSFSSEG